MSDLHSHPGEGRLNDYVDGLLDPDAVAVIERHLARCAPCAAEVAALEQVTLALGTLPELALERSLVAGVLAEIEPAPLPDRRLSVALAVQLLLSIALLPAGWVVIASWLTLLPRPALEAWSARLIALLPAPAVGSWLPTLAPMLWLLVLAALALFWLLGNRALLAPVPPRGGER